MENILYKKNRVLIRSNYENPKPHRHFAKHILFCTKPFECVVEDKKIIANSALIQSKKKHFIIKEKDATMFVYLIDDTSDFAKFLDKKYFGKAFLKKLPRLLEKNMMKRLSSEYALDRIDAYLIHGLGYEEEGARAYDKRVTWAIEYIDKIEEINQDLYDIIPRKLSISKSRFSHLFKNEVGIDLKNYLLIKKWKKRIARL